MAIHENTVAIGVGSTVKYIMTDCGSTSFLQVYLLIRFFRRIIIDSKRIVLDAERVNRAWFDRPRPGSVVVANYPNRDVAVKEAVVINYTFHPATHGKSTLT